MSCCFVARERLREGKLRCLCVLCAVGCLCLLVVFVGCVESFYVCGRTHLHMPTHTSACVHTRAHLALGEMYNRAECLPAALHAALGALAHARAACACK